MKKTWNAAKLLAIAIVTLACSSYLQAKPLPKTASFDCRKATSGVENLICSNKELQELDFSLAQTYQKKASRDDVDFDTTVSGQRNWLKNIRNKCASVECLKLAYKERLYVLNGQEASFGCTKATSRLERLICSDDGLRYLDETLNLNYRALKALSGNLSKVISEQKNWLLNVDSHCANIPCLKKEFDTRAKQLRRQRENILESIHKDIGYTKKIFYSDVILFPGDSSRTIAIFATQKSSTENPPTREQDTEDFILDIYVLDTLSHKVLQHASDSIISDAIALRGFSLVTTNYTTLLGVPSFGLNISHSHHGCAGYSSNALRIYAIDRKTVKTILADIVVNSSTEMCQAGCEGKSTERNVHFEHQLGIKYPDMIVREKIINLQNSSGREKNTCKTTASQNEYKLPFDGTQYKLPQGLDF